MENFLLPDVLNVNHIFGKVLLTLNDSYCIAEQRANGTIEYQTHNSFWTKLGFDKSYFGRHWMEVIDKKAHPAFLSKLNAFYISDEPAFVSHVPILNENQEVLWYIVQTVRLGDVTDKNQSFLFMLKDVSAKRREHKLLKDGQRIVKMGYWEWDIPSAKITWSDVTKEIHEVPKNYVPNLETGINFYKEGNSRDRIKEFIERTLATGAPYQEELELVTAKGNEIWVETRAKADMENGKCVRIYGTFQDITARKKIEDQLRINEESFRGAFENAAIGMAIVGPNGEWLRVNESLIDIVGYSKDELYKLTFEDITHPDDLEKDLSKLESLVEGKINSYQIEKRYIHRDGHIVWIILSVSMVKDAQGKPLYFVSQITDITERIIAQTHLQNALMHIQGILDASTQVSIISTDVNGLITEFNKGAENLLGYAPEEMIGINSPAIIHLEEEVVARGKELSKEFGETIEGFEVFVYKAKMGEFESREWTYVHKDGSQFPVQLVVTAMHDKEGNLTGFLGLATDLTQRKMAEDLEQKMAILESKSQEMEQFAYITSHDLREPLITITNYVSMIREEMQDDWTENAHKFFHFIERAALHLNGLVNGLLSYSRLSNTPDLKTIQLNEVIEEVQHNLSQIIEKNEAKITVGDLPKIQGYPEHIYILFQNLVQNSIKFKAEERPIAIEISAKQTKHSLEVIVADNGQGIDSKFREKVFTIFQRLHDRGLYEGTGLGLALVKKVAELHNAQVEIQDNPSGEGCRFVIAFPLESMH